jgi:hypothetical protein
MDSKYGSSREGWCSSEPIRAYEVGLWKNIMRGWGNFEVMLDLRWEIDPRLDSGMIFGVGIQPLRKPFMLY